MNLREVIRSGYKNFNRMGDEKKKAHIYAIQYIELLATQTGTKMEPWDLLQVFGSGKGNELVTDKKEINQRFFAKLEEIKTKTPAEVFQLESRIAERIDALSRTTTSRIKSDMMRQRDRHIEAATRNANGVTISLTEAHRIELQIMAIDGRESTVSSQIAKIVQENFWEFHELTDRFLQLVTKNDVIINHKNVAAGIDIRVNLGRFLVSIDLESMNLLLLAYEDNINAAGYVHPHVSSSGQICWGTAAGTVMDKLPKGQLEDVLRLLASVLVNYNDSNPYQHLQAFDAEQKRRAKPVRSVTPARLSEQPVLGMVDTPLGERIRDLHTLGVTTSPPIRTPSRADLSSEIGHPVDSLTTWDTCSCNQCETGREMLRLRSEFDRTNPVLTVTGTATRPGVGFPMSNVEFFVQTTPEDDASF